MWFGLRARASSGSAASGPRSEAADTTLHLLRTRGASFAHDLAAAADLTDERLRGALRELVAEGAVSSDSFAGIRAIIGTPPASSGGRVRGTDRAGRWFALQPGTSEDTASAAWIETYALVLLQRYGVVFRRLLARETGDVPWRDLVRVYRRLEARGDIRGGRFVTGASGEQFALPEAVERLREVRRTAADNRLVTISAADPLNLLGVLNDGERVRVSSSNRIVFRNGIALAAMEGDMLRMLTHVDPAIAADVAAAAAGRRVPVLSGFVGRSGT